MSIVAECPHCETRFHLQPAMVGKTMRCPNPACREPFEVKEAPPKRKPGQPPAPAPTKPAAPAKPAAGSVGEFVEVVEAELVSSAPPPRPKPPKPQPPKPAAPQPPAEPEVVEAVVVAPPPAKEVVWSAGADLPPPPPKPRQPVRAAAVSEPDDDEPLVRRRKKKKNWGPVVLIGMLVGIVVGGGSIGFYLWWQNSKAEERLAVDADKFYKDGQKYAEAEKAFNQLVTEFPGSDNVPKYRFFAGLSAVQKAVRAVTNVDDPRPSMDKLRAFIEANKESRFARPDGTDAYGHDIVDAGRKVADDVGTYAQNRVKAFRADYKKTDELRLAEEMIAAGRDFLPLLTPFRTKEDPTPGEIGRAAFDPPLAEIGRERDRLAALARVRELLNELTDQSIEDAKDLLAEKGLPDDEEGKALIRAAEDDFVRRVRYEPYPAAPVDVESGSAASLVFVAPVGPTRPVTRTPADGPPAVFLAVARGVLYALDEDTGDLLWTARVGPDVSDPPAVVRLDAADGPTDLALVTSNVAGKPAVSAYLLRTGEPKWHQPLTAPAAGAAAVVGTRAFVPVRDAAGTVYEFDLATGDRRGRLMTGQPVGPGVVARPGTSQLYVAAESRRVFVFDADASDGTTVRPRCIRVIPTGHAPGTLRTPPVILGPPGDDPAPRWLVLAQADGPTAMKLRAFRLPTTTPAGDAPVIETIAPSTELPLPGWVWFPPTTDGEQLVAVTDAGQFRLYGLNLVGNQDADLFPFPQPALPTPPGGTPVPGLAVPAEGGAFWVLAGGSLQKFELRMLPEKGQAVVPLGAGLAVGVPTQAAQLSPRRDTACFVVRSANSSGCRAVAVRLRDGEPRWQRQLGVVPTAAPVASGDGLLLVGEDGTAAAVPASGVAIPPGKPAKADPNWVIGSTLDGVTGPTQVAASADGQTVFTLTPTTGANGAKWVFRRVAGGKVEDLGSVDAKPDLAGRPVVVGAALFLPSTDGYIYRLEPGSRARQAKLSPGPKWHLDRRTSEPACFVVPLSDDSFLASDGGRVLKRYTWPAGGGWSDGGSRWDVRERVAAAVLLPASGDRPARLLVADVTGGVWLYAAEQGGAVTRRWVPGRTVSLPGGTVGGFAVQADATGRQLVCYTVEGKQPEDRWLIGLDADRDDPLWVRKLEATEGGVVGLPAAAGRGWWLVTDLAGRVVVLNAETGKPARTTEAGLPGAVPATAGVPAGEGRVLVPLSDGSAAVVELPAEPKAKE